MKRAAIKSKIDERTPNARNEWTVPNLQHTTTQRTQQNDAYGKVRKNKMMMEKRLKEPLTFMI